jgi:predicted transcriptional regulator
MLQKLDIISSMLWKLMDSQVYYRQLANSFKPSDKALQNQLADNIASEISESICNRVFQSENKELHLEVRAKVKSVIKPLILKNVKEMYKAIEEIYKENKIDPKSTLEEAAKELKKVNKDFSQIDSRFKLSATFCYDQKMIEAVNLALNAEPNALINAQKRGKAERVKNASEYLNRVKETNYPVEVEEIDIEYSKNSEQGVVQGSVPVEIYRVKVGGWFDNIGRSIDLSFNSLNTFGINSNTIIALIYNGAGLPYIDYKKMNALIEKATSQEKEHLLNYIAEVITTYPQENTRGFVNNLLASENKELSNFGKALVSKIVSIEQGSKQTKTPLEEALEKHPNTFARMFLKQEANNSINFSNSQSLTYKEINALNKVIEKIEDKSHKHAPSPLEAIKSFLNAVLSHISKDLGLKSETFKTVLDNLKERGVLVEEQKQNFAANVKAKGTTEKGK